MPSTVTTALAPSSSTATVIVLASSSTAANVLTSSLMKANVLTEREASQDSLLASSTATVLDSCSRVTHRQMAYLLRSACLPQPLTPSAMTARSLRSACLPQPLTLSAMTARLLRSVCSPQPFMSSAITARSLRSACLLQPLTPTAITARLLPIDCLPLTYRLPLPLSLTHCRMPCVPRRLSQNVRHRWMARLTTATVLD